MKNVNDEVGGQRVKTEEGYANRSRFRKVEMPMFDGSHQPDSCYSGQKGIFVFFGFQIQKRLRCLPSVYIGIDGQITAKRLKIGRI